MSFFTGTDPYTEQVSRLSKTQKPIQSQLEKSAQGKGAGGAYGTSADYYYDILNNDPAAMAAFEAPEQRRFNEQIIPDLSEQFAGMGAGNLSSSGFRNAAVSAGTDLSERLGAIRANLRQQAAQGLQNIGQQSLQPTFDTIQHPGTEGFLSTIAPLAAQAVTAYASGGTSLLPQAANTMAKGSTSPYGKMGATGAMSGSIGAMR